MKVAIIGNGIIGLSTALYLSEQGVNVHVYYSRERTRTSLSAAAFWYPFAVETTEEEERQLSYPTLQFYRQLSIDSVRTVRAHQYFDDSSGMIARSRPWWMKSKEFGVNYRKISQSKLPKVGDEIGPVVEGWEFEIPVIDVRRFLLWMEGELVRSPRFVRIDEATITRFDQLDDLHFDAIVNCSGIWATHLTTDGRLTGKQGVVIDAPLKYCSQRLKFLEHGKCSARPVYVVPNSDHCVLGGTLEQVTANGARLLEGDNQAWMPRTFDLERILDRCRLIEPKLNAWTPTIDELKARARAAPRPVRDGVAPRIGVDPSVRGIKVVHNYGHGGSGYTMFWGAAKRVWEILSEKQQPQAKKVETK